MKNFTGTDGLVLCVVCGKIDIKRWIDGIDMLDHSIINYEELLRSVNALLWGGLTVLKKNRFAASKKAKRILRGGLFTRSIDWQLKVQKRIQDYSYEEGDNAFCFSEQAYAEALEKYLSESEKFSARFAK